MATRGCRSSRSRHGPVARARRSPQKRARNSSILGSSHAAEERFVTRIRHVPYILALDQGTSSSRAIVFDARGRKLGAAQKELTQHFPKPGWVEHDADEIWETTRASARNALKEAGLRARDLAAIGITNQRETIVLWDRRTGRPLHRAIVWQDRRTAVRHGSAARGRPRARRAPEDRASFSTRTSRARSSAGSSTTFPARGRKPRQGRLAAGTIDSWLVWNLTGGRRHVTDVSNASRTMLMNLRTGRWDAELRRLLAIPARILPEIVSSGGRIADTDAGVLGASVPIAGILGDQQAALFGQLCTRPGLAKCTYGTGCFLLAFTGARPIASRNRLLSTVAWRIGEGPMTYALEGSVFSGGAAIQWLRDGLEIIRVGPGRQRARRFGPGLGRRRRRPGLHGPRRAGMGRDRAGRGPRPDARLDAGPTSPAPRSKASRSRSPTF